MSSRLVRNGYSRPKNQHVEVQETARIETSEVVNEPVNKSESEEKWVDMYEALKDEFIDETEAEVSEPAKPEVKGTPIEEPKSEQAESKAPSSASNKPVYLNNVSVRMINKGRNQPEGTSSIGFAYEGSVTGLANFNIDDLKITPSTRKDGTIIKNFMSVNMGAPDDVRDVLVATEKSESGRATKIKTIQLTNREIQDSFLAEREAYLKSREMKQKSEPASGKKEVYIRNLPVRMVNDSKSTPGKKNVGFAYEGSANGLANITVNPDSISQSKTRDGKPITGRVDVLLGYEGSSREVSLSEGKDENGRNKYKTINITVDEIKDSYYSYRSKRYASQIAKTQAKGEAIAQSEASQTEAQVGN